MLQIPCVIFAGGKSSRMGEDKALLPFGNFSSLTEYQYTRLSKIFQNVYISAKDPSKFSFKANFIKDPQNFPDYAPTAGFVATFTSLKEDAFFALSVDSPFVEFEQIQKIIEADSSSFDATIAKTAQGIQPMCGIYHRSLENKFQTMLQNSEHKLGLLLHNVTTHYVSFEDEKPFLNLNHPDEYNRALELI
ncbi:molybdenum cofactor guanylyltransferase MobA [Sulfurimonas sp.]